MFNSHELNNYSSNFNHYSNNSNYLGNNCMINSRFTQLYSGNNYNTSFSYNYNDEENSYKFSTNCTTTNHGSLQVCSDSNSPTSLILNSHDEYRCGSSMKSITSANGHHYGAHIKHLHAMNGPAVDDYHVITTTHPYMNDEDDDYDEDKHDHEDEDHEEDVLGGVININDDDQRHDNAAANYTFNQTHLASNHCRSHVISEANHDVLSSGSRSSHHYSHEYVDIKPNYSINPNTDMNYSNQGNNDHILPSVDNYGDLAQLYKDLINDGGALINSYNVHGPHIHSKYGGHGPACHGAATQMHNNGTHHKRVGNSERTMYHHQQKHNDGDEGAGDEGGEEEEEEEDDIDQVEEEEEEEEELEAEDDEKKGVYKMKKTSSGSVQCKQLVEGRASHRANIEYTSGQGIGVVAAATPAASGAIAATTNSSCAVLVRSCSMANKKKRKRAAAISVGSSRPAAVVAASSSSRAAGSSPPPSSSSSSKSKKKNREELENQRMTHIAVERNRRRQMNEHLTALRSMMPSSYVQRGDQASIVGGAIRFVEELEQLVQCLHLQKQLRSTSAALANHAAETAAASGLISPFNAELLSITESSTRGPSCLSHLVGTKEEYNAVDPSLMTSGCMTREGSYAASSSSLASVEVNMQASSSTAFLKVLAHKMPRQLFHTVSSFARLYLKIMHLSISTINPTTILYSFNLKMDDDCQLQTPGELVEVVQNIFDICNNA